MTATVETMAEQLDMAAIMPAEKVLPAIARSVTLTEADTGTYLTQRQTLFDTNLNEFYSASATAQIAKPQLLNAKAENDTIDASERDENLDEDSDLDADDFWYTSAGKFKKSFDLPQSLQYIHQLLVELPNIEKPDILYFMLQCLNVLALHGDALSDAARDHRGFFIWCQENLLIKK